MKEKVIVNQILRYLNSLEGCYARKVMSSMYGSGFPDIVCCIGGRLIWFEVKRPGGKLTKLQELELIKWSQTGAIAEVIWSLDDVKEAVRTLIVKSGV